jgi:hypothetical protein
MRAKGLRCGLSLLAGDRRRFAGFKPHRANAATLAREKHISVRVAELQEEQLAIHKQATAEGVANAKVIRRDEMGRFERRGNL